MVRYFLFTKKHASLDISNVVNRNSNVCLQRSWFMVLVSDVILLSPIIMRPKKFIRN